MIYNQTQTIHYTYQGIEMEAIDAFPVVKVVGGVVLAACGELELGPAVLPVIRLLEATDIGSCILCSHFGVLTRRLLTPAPPWVSKHIHVRTPHCQPRLPAVVHRPCLVRHHLHTLIILSNLVLPCVNLDELIMNSIILSLQQEISYNLIKC